MSVQSATTLKVLYYRESTVTSSMPFSFKMGEGLHLFQMGPRKHV